MYLYLYYLCHLSTSLPFNSPVPKLTLHNGLAWSSTCTSEQFQVNSPWGNSRDSTHQNLRGVVQPDYIKWYKYQRNEFRMFHAKGTVTENGDTAFNIHTNKKKKSNPTCFIIFITYYHSSPLAKKSKLNKKIKQKKPTRLINPLLTAPWQVGTRSTRPTPS